VEAYRGAALQRRAPACLRFLRVKDLEAARLKLEHRPELAAATASVVLLGVTEFGRDPSVFAQLRAVVLPELRGLQRPPRVWSAACSDGRELYSVALALGEAGLLDRAELLGTDCRADAVACAEEATFPAGTLADLDLPWEPYFVRERDKVRAKEALRSRARWKQADLLVRAEAGPWDLLLWRNMAIYLHRSAARRVWETLVAELAPGGFLVTGKADHPPEHPLLKRIGPCLYRRKDPAP
jgi:chemotaxis methyl-accepting protein methylase